VSCCLVPSSIVEFTGATAILCSVPGGLTALTKLLGNPVAANADPWPRWFMAAQSKDG
jgi:uncharacterized membrane protein AbrB (regulator of aidB expression)